MPSTFAGNERPSASWQRISLDLSMTWWFVRTSPSAEMTTPEPDATPLRLRPDSVSLTITRMNTTDGATAAFASETTCRKSGVVDTHPAHSAAAASAAMPSFFLTFIFSPPSVNVSP